MNWTLLLISIISISSGVGIGFALVVLYTLLQEREIIKTTKIVKKSKRTKKEWDKPTNY